MIITIDGPVASGKSTIAKLLAKKLNIYYLYTGLLYRALAYLLVKELNYKEENLSKPNVEDLKKCLDFNYTYDDEAGEKIFYNGEDITYLLKAGHMDRLASILSKNKLVRQVLLEYQRDFAKKNDLIAEGRDCGSVVFPNADYKFFMTALTNLRVERWLSDQAKRGKNYSQEEANKIVFERDLRDTSRKESPLIIPEGAIVVDNSQGLDATVNKILEYIKRP